jgi:ribose 5-phosphate isomerase A
MTWVGEAKRRAAEAASALVENGTVIGLGSGSTATHFIRQVGTRLSSGDLNDILGVPTSYQAAADALEAAIPLTTLDEHPELDLTVDGADQIDGNLDAIKGGGGALLREKVVASTSKKYVIIADSNKLVETLGEGQPLPVEVLPYSIGAVIRKIEELKGIPVLRMGGGKLGPVVTDNGNFIIDIDFGAIREPSALDARLKGIPGILETGLFLGYAGVAYVGKRDTVEEIVRN